MAVPRKAGREARLEIARKQVPDTRHTLGLRTAGNGGYPAGTGSVQKPRASSVDTQTKKEE